jgi:hypothetical protein
MIEAFVKIRLKQFYRGLIGVGLIRIIFLIGLLGFIGFVLFIETSESPDSFYVAGLTSFILFMVQTKRQDKSFLKTNFDRYKLICFVEYLILASVPLIFLLFHSQGIPFLLLIASIYLIIHLDLKSKQRNLNTRLQQLIPSECFEWKGGVRQTLFVLIPLWLIGMGTSFSIGSVPIVLFILGVIPFSFYEKGEPYQMIIACEMRASQFLFHKIKMQITMFSVLSIPLIAAFLVFHPEIWYIPVIEYLIFISLYIYLILTKYAFYEPNSKSTSAQVFGAIGAFGGIIPVFLPVVWLLSIRFFFKSKENLNIYLNDYN